MTKMRKRRKKQRIARRCKQAVAPLLGLLLVLYIVNVVSYASNVSDAKVVESSEVTVENLQMNTEPSLRAGISRVLSDYVEEAKIDAALEIQREEVIAVSSPNVYSAGVANAISVSSITTTAIEDQEEQPDSEVEDEDTTEVTEEVSKAEEIQIANEFVETRSEEKFVPDYCGSVHPYMGWQTITCKGTKQYELRMEAQNFDSDGIGKVKDRYAVAVKPYYGEIGDFLNVVQNDGTVYKCIIVDFKGMENESKDGWLATYAHGENDIIEFVVDKDSWYGTDKSIRSIHPEWAHNIKSITNVGNYWDSED
jgi:hypothetical protein